RLLSSSVKRYFYTAVKVILLSLFGYLPSQAQDLSWVIQFGDSAGWGMYPASMYPHELKSDASGNIYVLGSFVGLVDFDPGPGNTSFLSHADLARGYFTDVDYYLSKYDSSGRLLRA